MSTNAKRAIVGLVGRWYTSTILGTQKGKIPKGIILEAFYTKRERDSK